MTDHLGRLPVEICGIVAGLLPSCMDISSVARTSRDLYLVFNPSLYRRLSTLEDASTVVHWAAFKGLTRVIDLAHAQGIDIDASGRVVLFHTPDGTDIRSFCSWVDDHYEKNSECHPLHLAVVAGHRRVVTQLLNYGAAMDSPSGGVCRCSVEPRGLGDLVLHIPPSMRNLHHDAGWTPLHVALCSGQLHIAQLLYSRDTRRAMCVRGGAQSTGLHAACVSGDLAVVQWWNTLGLATSQVNEADWRVHTPINYAYLYGHIKCFRYLLSLGADVNHGLTAPTRGPNQTHIRMTMLRDALIRGRYRDALLLLDLDRIDREGALPSLIGRAWGVRSFPGKEHLQPQPDAVELGGKILQQLLASSQCPITLLNSSLGYAAWHHNLPAMKILVQAGADVNSWCGKPDFERAPTPGTPLTRALFPAWPVGTIPVVAPGAMSLVIAWLLENGACPNLTQGPHLSPLQMVYSKPTQGRGGAALEEIGRMLVDFGAQTNRGTWGECSWTGGFKRPSPLESTVRAGQEANFEYFLQACGGGSALTDDDILGLWYAAVTRGRKVSASILRRIIQLDQYHVVARLAPEPVKDVLRCRPVLADLVRKLLQLRETQVDHEYLDLAVMNEAEPSLVREIIEMIPEGSRSEREQRRILLDFLSSSHSPNQASSTRVLDMINIFHDAGVSLHGAGDHSSGDGRSVLNLVITELEDERLVDIILARQPLEQQPAATCFAEVEACLLRVYPHALRSAVASMGDGQSLIAANAGWLSFSVLRRTQDLRFVSTIVDCIECLECLYGLEHSLPVFDRAIVPTPSDHHEDTATVMADKTYKNRCAKEFLMRLTDLAACDRSDRRMLGVTWLFHQMVEFDGTGQPVFNKMPLDIRHYMNGPVGDLPWVSENWEV